MDLLVGFKGSAGVKEPDTYLKQVNMLTGRAPGTGFNHCRALFLAGREEGRIRQRSKPPQTAIHPGSGYLLALRNLQDKAFRDTLG